MIIKVNRKDIKDTENPILDYCKKLIKNGEDPGSRLEIYRHREEFDYAINNIGEFVGKDYRPMSEDVKEKLRLKRRARGYGQTADAFKS